MANRMIAGLCLVAVAAMFGCADPASGPADARPADAGPGSAANPSQHVVEAPTHSFVKTWTMNLDLEGKQTLKALYLRPGRVFAYTSDNDVYAYDRTNGSPLFVATTVVPPGKQLWAPIVLANYMVFPSAFTNEVYSIKGDLIRSQQLPFSVTSNGCAGAGTFIYIGATIPGGELTAAGRLAHVDVSSAYVPLDWSLVTGGVSGTPAYSGGTCYAGGGDGYLYAVDDLRHSAWSLSATQDRFKMDDAIHGDIAVDGASVYAASMDTRLYCIDRSTGKLRWQYFAQVPLPEGPVVTGSNIYQMVPGTGLVAISKTSTGAIRKPAWTQADAREFLAEDDRYVYLLMADNSLLAANKATGETVFQSAKTDFVQYAPDNNNKDGMFFAGTLDGRVCQIKPVLAPGVIGEMIPQRAADDASAGH